MSKFISCEDCIHYGADAPAVLCQNGCYNCIHYKQQDNFKPKPKPKSKIIDLSKMVGSNIDMEFKGGEYNWFMGRLKGIYGNDFKYKMVTPLFANSFNSSWSQCRIRQDHWHHWNGGECPLPEGLVVELELTDGTVTRHTNYKKISWNEDKHDEWCVRAFMVIGTADEWRYEWEQE